ncbi:MAG: DUF2971 domain-containing protein [Sulfuricurvum sp.]|nr:DUF2971 domain-containing protein [Sulfuricurvum sp.]
MSLDDEKLQKICMPYLSKQQQVLKERNNQFVHYTSADNAKNIIQSKRLWMRSPKCMNDYMEIEHGHSQLVDFFNTQKHKDYFSKIMNSIAEDASDIILNQFDEWWKKIENDIYIASISIHHADENQSGRLSMWRAYGEHQAKAALVLNNPPEPIKGLALILSPAAYFTYEELESELLSMINNINDNMEFIKTLDSNKVLVNVITYLITLAVCLKHPGFKEEGEWRVIYLPKMQEQANELIEKSVESIAGVPQIVYKLVLEEYKNLEVTSMSIPNLVNKIIIGPTQYPLALLDAFHILLNEAGVSDTSNKIVISDIPLRT